MHQLTFLSLFAGIGGFDLGFERAGMRCVGQVEIDDYATKVLEKHWPKVSRWRDIKTFPPHPSGRRAGIKGTRSKLWKQYIRTICILRPRYLVVENVAALLGRGMDTVLSDISKSGYNAEWEVLSARDFGSIHLRERVFIVAYSGQKRGQRIFQEKIPMVKAFSWCENVRSVEDLRARPSIPQPLIRGNSDGIPCRVDRTSCLGNSIIPQAAEYIARQIIRFEKAIHAKAQLN